MTTRITLGLVARSALAACIGLALAACATMQKKPASKKTAEPYRVESEGKVPPLAAADVRKQADEEEKFEDLPVAEEGVVVEEFTPPAEAVPAPAAQPAAGARTAPAPAPSDARRDTMGGYRIQVFASGNEAAARSVKEAAEVSVGVPAYIELVDGVYKVRVGDCPSRPEAEALLAKCRAAGYGDAWIATTTIFVPRKDKTQ
jgi:septal ring-binding cell division protein DamX